jgi:hypothetical protein
MRLVGRKPKTLVGREPKTLAAALIACAALLAGCGGGEETASTDAAAAGGGASQGTEAEAKAKRAELKKKIERARAKQNKQQAQEQGGSGTAKQRSEVPFEEPSGPAPTPSGSLPNEGTKRVAPGVPTAKGGDNSIQEYGVEGPSAERVEAARVLQAYLDARLAGDWARACSYLAAPTKKQLLQFGKQAQRDGSESLGCAGVMRAFTQGLPRSALRSAAEIRVLSMRVEAEQAFLIYRDGKGVPSAIPMAREGGGWRVAAIAGSGLVLGAGSL